MRLGNGAPAPSETIYQAGPIVPAGRSAVKRVSRSALAAVILLLMFTVALNASGPTGGSLKKPTYAAGDQWVYVLEGSLTTFPGFNASQGPLQFTIVGFVYVNVIGPATVLAGTMSIPSVRVDSRATGFLNGTFAVPNGGTAQVRGSFTTSSTEYWEDQAYMAIESRSTSSYHADVTYGITTSLVADLRLTTTTSVSTIPPFDLDVGQNATAELSTHAELNSTFSVFGQTMHSQNETNVSSMWRRDVLARENVTVENGTFSSYKLNQTLTNFPVIPTGLSGGGNETAYWSNDVGFYVKRVAYENGTPAAEMRLRSYSFGAGPPSGLSATQVVLIIAVPVAIALLLAFLWWRRRKARIQGRTSPRAPSAPDGPQQGGNDRAR